MMTGAPEPGWCIIACCIYHSLHAALHAANAACYHAYITSMHDSVHGQQCAWAAVCMHYVLGQSYGYGQ